MQRPQGRKAHLINSLDAARALLAPALHDARDERLYIAHLDEQKRLLGIRIRFATGGRTVEFPVRAIIGDAVNLATRALILAHNHPSGDPTPSATDIEATRSLVQVARPMGVAVCDHLVFGSSGRFVSFRQRGLL